MWRMNPLYKILDSVSKSPRTQRGHTKVNSSPARQLHPEIRGSYHFQSGVLLSQIHSYHKNSNTY